MDLCSQVLPRHYDGKKEARFPNQVWLAMFRNRLLYGVVGVLILGLFLIIVNVYELKRVTESHYAVHHPIAGAPVEISVVSATSKPKVCVIGKHIQSGYLKHIIVVFERLGFEKSEQFTECSFIWTHDYPFATLRDKILAIKPTQMLNHFPGSGYITNKVNLATSKIDFIPPAFKMPSQKAQLLEYSKKYPQKLFVQKSNNHRGIEIKNLDNLDLSVSNTFVQEYVDKPFLIDGHKFDIGIYTVLTSIDPLRVYILDDELLLRFCPAQYYPFDPKNVDKYVVGDDYLPTWQVPSLKRIYVDQSNNFKQTLSTYLRLKGHNVEKLFRNIKESIRQVYLEKEIFLVQATKGFASSRNFFEMVRFDFVLDENLKPYLMEVNMSPNLSTGHFSQNRELYEHVVFDLLNLVGTTSVNLPQENVAEQEMLVSNRMIQVYAEKCNSMCSDNCMHQICKLCHQCMTMDDKSILKRAYLEHMNRRNYRRVFPPATSPAEAAQWDPAKDDKYAKLNDRNKWMHMWFIGKCIQDPTWCW